MQMEDILILRTLKGKTIEEQYSILESLVDKYLVLGDGFRSYLNDCLENRIFQLKESIEARQIIRIILLSIVAADVGTIPSRYLSEPYLQMIKKLCAVSNISEADVMDLSKYASIFEKYLTGDFT